MSAVFELKNVTKQFGRQVALNNVSLVGPLSRYWAKTELARPPHCEFCWGCWNRTVERRASLAWTAGTMVRKFADVSDMFPIAPPFTNG